MFRVYLKFENGTGKIYVSSHNTKEEAQELADKFNKELKAGFTLRQYIVEGEIK